MPAPQAQTFSLGSAAEREVQDIVAAALRKARVLVATIREYMDVYRNPAGWLHAFSAFRLPSPLAGSARDHARAGSARVTDAREARRLLTRIAERGVATQKQWTSFFAYFPALSPTHARAVVPRQPGAGRPQSFPS